MHPTPALRRLACVLLGSIAVALAGCGTAPVTAEPVATAPLEAEKQASWSATRVGAPELWGRGASGAGTVVAMVDTGVRASHVELAGRVLAGHDAVTGGADTSDATGHGTHVAGLLAAARDGSGTVGIAPETRVLPVRVFAAGGASDAVLSAGVRWAAARTSILNLSLAAPAPIAAAAIRDAVAGGALVVVAAGNRGEANPEWPARFARESWANGAGLRGAVIAVGAVDADNRIASFSNRAGDTAAWYLVAPGVDLMSTGAGGDAAYLRMSGTSMAAPSVSGAAALLRSMWPTLSSGEIASILLTTARDLGAPGVDVVYGRGLLDVEAAMRPIGELRTATADGTSVPVAATGLRLSPATAAIARAAAAGLPLVAQDAYRRDYSTDLSARIAAPRAQPLARTFDALDQRLQRVEQSLPGGVRLSMQSADSFSLVGRDGGGEFAFGAGAGAVEYFGVASGLDVGALANPYAGLASRGAMVARGLHLGDTTLKAGVVGGDSTESTGSGWTPVDTRSTVVEATHRIGASLRLSAAWSRSTEHGAWLGAVGSGALAGGSASRTDAVQLGAAWTIAPGTVLAGTWAHGRTEAPTGAGLIGAAGATHSDAASVALVRADAWRAGDRVSLSLSQPMRTRSGDAVATLQSGVDAGGAPVMTTHTFSLVPDGRERVAELAYRAPLGRDAALTAVLSLRRQPNHDATAADDRLVAVRYLRQF